MDVRQMRVRSRRARWVIAAELAVTIDVRLFGDEVQQTFLEEARYRTNIMISNWSTRGPNKSGFENIYRAISHAGLGYRKAWHTGERPLTSKNASHQTYTVRHDTYFAYTCPVIPSRFAKSHKQSPGPCYRDDVKDTMLINKKDKMGIIGKGPCGRLLSISIMLTQR